MVSMNRTIPPLKRARERNKQQDATDITEGANSADVNIIALDSVQVNGRLDQCGMKHRRTGYVVDVVLIDAGE